MSPRGAAAEAWLLRGLISVATVTLVVAVTTVTGATAR